MEPDDDGSKLAEEADLGPLPIAIATEETGSEESSGNGKETPVSGDTIARQQAPNDELPSNGETQQSTMQFAERTPLQEGPTTEGEAGKSTHRSMEVLQSDGTPPPTERYPQDDDEESNQLVPTDRHHHHQQEEVPEECTVFAGLTYLGSSTVDAPMSASEANTKMITFKEQHAQAIPVNLSIPQTNAGKIVMLDPLHNTPLALFYIKTVLLCVRGQELDVSDCICINVRHRKSQSFHCHVFLVNTDELCEKLFLSIGNAFRTKPSDLEILRDGFQLSYEMEVILDIQEDHEGRANYHSVAMDKDCFKLRQGAPKMITMSIAQPSSNRPLIVDKCFGALIAPGRDVPPMEMILLDMVSMGYSSDRVYSIVSAFDPAELPAKELNEETPKGSKAYLTVAADLVLRGIAEPVRFLREVEVRIYKGDSFDLFGSLRKRRQSIETFILQVEKATHSSGKSPQYCISVMQSTEGKQQQQPYAAIPSAEEPKSPLPPAHGEGEGGEADSDQEFLEDDEILVSGWGDINKDFSDDLVGEWGVMLEKWDGQDKSRPKSLRKLCRKGIPGPLRCQVWQLLTAASYDPQLVDAYRLLITMESPTKDVIVWDIKRTYVAHEFFREPSGREALEKISKAYSVYDEEVGYCQGLSFIVAVLLLQKLPEEMAFAALVKIMFDNKHRDLFKGAFETLHLCLFQLSKLVEEYMPDLSDHFAKHRVEVHMFATQWFFTLFTAKFPLPLVFQFMDVYLCDRMPAMFQAALALLKTAKKELLQMDFEGMLKYFRVSLPRKFLTQEETNHFFRRMSSFKIDERRMKKFEKEYQSLLEAKALAEDPQERLKEENSHLREAVGRLEHENECLAQELVASKINLREEMDKLEERVDGLSKEARRYQREVEIAQSSISELRLELQESKELCSEMTAKLAEERQHHQVAINEYRTAFRQLDEGNMKEQEDLKQQLAALKVSKGASKLSKGASNEDGEEVADGDRELESCTKLEQQVRELELELAQTKLALVEAACRAQELEHKMSLPPPPASTSSKKGGWFGT